MESKDPEDLDRYSTYRTNILQVFLNHYPLEDYDAHEEVKACDELVKKYTYEKAKAMVEYALSTDYPYFLTKASQLVRYQRQVIERKKEFDKKNSL